MSLKKNKPNEIIKINERFDNNTTVLTIINEIDHICDANFRNIRLTPNIDINNLLINYISKESIYTFVIDNTFEVFVKYIKNNV